MPADLLEMVFYPKIDTPSPTPPPSKGKSCMKSCTVHNIIPTLSVHDIVDTYHRLYDECKGVFQQDCDDDGETAAGGRLLHLLQVN